ncbi:MAG TPA: 3-hydroxyacyl-ACP dehydratase FabZ family protein [Thermodesulfovibrionales bacterium]|nr:3-hydroxyacyl-ACP dehydratase FabZ family protein [Thermodesulfovibrionales bacterium]
MRYLLLDRILEWKSGESIRGIKNVTMSEDFLEFHFPRKPIMPGVLLLESLAQLTGWLEAASSDFKNWFLITKVQTCKFYGFAFPGDQVELMVRSGAGATPGKKVFTGTGTVGGKKKIAVDFEGETISLEEIEDADEQRRFFRLLTREI